MNRKRIQVKTYQILKFLKKEMRTTDAILNVCLTGYQRSYRDARGREEILRSSGSGRGSGGGGIGSFFAERERFYKMMSYLKQEGLIEKRKDEKGWDVTKQGLEKLELLEEKEKFSPALIDYEEVEDVSLRVVIFDIPERDRHKREWIRVGLVALGFRMCQQSVWVGKRKIPKNFIEDLRDRELLQCVHIFEVSKRGSLSDFLK